MSPVPGHGTISLTKNVQPAALQDSLAGLQPGVDTGASVRAALARGNAANEPLWDDIVLYNTAAAASTSILQDDEMLAACRTKRADALLLVWAALMLSDERMTRAVQALALPDGRLDPTLIHRSQAQNKLSSQGLPAGSKDTTNLLGLLEDVGLIKPRRSAGSIVGVDAFLPTRDAVPALVRLLEQRLPKHQLAPGGGSGWVDLAVAIGANTWLNLTPQEFRAAAILRPTAAPRPLTAPLPADLVELDTQLRRQLQVVLQGPPGGGKTFRARRYVKWATVGALEENRLQTLVESLPSNERSPQAVAREIEHRGAAAVWDIVQFHPAYSYSSFVRALVAEPVAGGVSFVPQHRILSFVAAVAEELNNGTDPVPVILIIDEINRGDISAIFGELLYALEYRGHPVMTPHTVDGRASLLLPPNLLLIGTMNTADRSIAVIDYALRRRFVFLDVPADPRVIRQAAFPGTAQEAAVHLFEAVEGLLKGTAPGMRVGPSYFLLPQGHGITTTDEAVGVIASRFAYEVLPLLREYHLEGELEQADLEHFLDAMGIGAETTQAEAARAIKAHLDTRPWDKSPTRATAPAPAAGGVVEPAAAGSGGTTQSPSGSAITPPVSPPDATSGGASDGPLEALDRSSSPQAMTAAVEGSRAAAGSDNAAAN